MNEVDILGLLLLALLAGAGWLAWSWGREELTEPEGWELPGPEPVAVIFDEAAELRWTRMQFPIGDVILPGDDVEVVIRRDGTVDFETSKGVNTIWRKNAV